MKEILVKLLKILASEESDSKVCLFWHWWIEITDSIYCCRGYRSLLWLVGWTFVVLDHPGVKMYSINSFCWVVGDLQWWRDCFAHVFSLQCKCMTDFLMLLVDYETCLWNKRLLWFGKLESVSWSSGVSTLFDSLRVGDLGINTV